jgi:hypothetical protein
MYLTKMKNLNSYIMSGHFRIVLAIAFLFSYSITSYSSTYKEAYKNYARRNLAGCIKSASKAIKRTKNRSQISDLFKLSGICYHQSKNTRAATKMFKNALRFNPATQVSASEVLDPSVVSFFNQIKSSSARKPQPTSPSPAPSPAKRQVAKGAYAKEAKSTSLIVNSNVSSALLMIDGIIVGRPGSPIEVDPGNNIITVSSRGYITRKVKVFVKKNQQLTITVDLNKPKPKPKPKPKRQQRRRTNDNNPVASGIPLPSTGLDSVAPSQPQSPNQMPPQFEGQGAYPPGTQQPGYPQPTYQQPAYGYQQPGYPQPGYPQPGYPQPAYPTQPYPQPAYPQPMYQQPMYVAPQAPAYPPAYTQPTPSYAAPAAEPIGGGLPPIDNNEGNIFNDSVKNYYESGEDDIFSAPEPKRKTRSRSKKSRSTRKSKPISRSTSYKSIRSKKSSKKSDKSMFVALLPLGAGQFQNGDYILGSIVAAAQLGTAGYGYMLDQESSTRTTAINTYIVEAQSASSDGTLTDEETTYVNNEKAAIEKIQTNRNYLLLGALATYVGGVTEAILSMDDKPKSSRKRKRRRYVQQNPTSIPLGRVELKAPSKNTELFDLGLEIDAPESENSPYLVTTLNWTF